MSNAGRNQHVTPLHRQRGSMPWAPAGGASSCHASSRAANTAMTIVIVLAMAHLSRQPNGADLYGVAQVGVAQVGVAQVGTAQVGAGQDGAAQVGAAQVGASAKASQVPPPNAR